MMFLFTGWETATQTIKKSLKGDIFLHFKTNKYANHYKAQILNIILTMTESYFQENMSALNEDLNAATS